MRRAAGIMALAAALQLPGCGYLQDLVTPQELSTSRCGVVTLDTALGLVRPAAGVSVSVGGVSSVSDSQGMAVLAGVSTGEQRLSVRSSRYVAQSRQVEVTLDALRDTVLLARQPLPPRILRFEARPARTLAVDDTVWFDISVADSGWPLRRVRVEYGGSSVPGSRTFVGGPVSYSAGHIYDSAGTYAAQLLAFDENNDSSLSAVETVEVSANRRPELKVSFSPTLYAGWDCWVDVADTGREADFASLVVDWGDGTYRETYFRRSGRYYHIYDSAQVYPFSIEACDSAGAMARYRVTLTVSRITPLLVSPQIHWDRAQTITLADTTITIGVTVLQSPGYVSAIGWQVNQGILDFQAQRYAVDAYDSVSGGIPPTGGTLFTHTFTTDSLLDTNHVRITVRDSYGLEMHPAADFYILGL